MKAKLMALFLAAGLGVTGIAMTAQAAEVGARAVNACEHDMFVKRTDVDEAINWGGGRHYVVYRVTYQCRECDYEEVKYEGGYEPHDYEQIYFDDGRVKSYCTVCDESYFW